MSDQAQFRAGLLDPTMPAPEGLLGKASFAAGKRYDVYRNNVTTSLKQAMSTAFPLVRKLIGGRNFDALATQFVRTHPPRSPLMMRYGAELPAFLSAYPPLAPIGYLADAARLDLAMRASYHAADARPFDPAILSGPPEALGKLHLRVAPATVVLRSQWPLHDIWRFNFVEGAPKPQGRAQDVVITRPEYDPLPHPAPPGAATFLSALADGADLDAATDLAGTRHPKDFDLAQSLTFIIEIQALAANS